MKALHAKWIMNLCDEITSEKGKEIVLNGQKAVRILDAVEMGSAKLKCLDPPGGGSISFEDDISSPKKVTRMLTNDTNQIQTMNILWMTNEMPSMPLLFRLSQIFANFFKHLFVCFFLFYFL